MAAVEVIAVIAGVVVVLAGDCDCAVVTEKGLKWSNGDVRPDCVEISGIRRMRVRVPHNARW